MVHKSVTEKRMETNSNSTDLCSTNHHRNQWKELWPFSKTSMVSPNLVSVIADHVERVGWYSFKVIMNIQWNSNNTITSLISHTLVILMISKLDSGSLSDTISQSVLTKPIWTVCRVDSQWNILVHSSTKQLVKLGAMKTQWIRLPIRLIKTQLHSL